MKRLRNVALALLFASLSGPNIASAATFQYDGFDLANQQADSGQITLYGSGPNTGQSFIAWCMDVYDWLQYSGTFTVKPLTTTGAPATAGTNPTLTQAQIGQIGALISYGNANINTNYNVSAAIQLAIWELEYGPSFTPDGFNSTVMALAATYVTDAKNGGPGWAPNYNVELLVERGNQSLAYVTPLPATWTMLLPMLAALGLFAYRRQNQGAAMIAA